MHEREAIERRAALAAVGLFGVSALAATGLAQNQPASPPPGRDLDSHRRGGRPAGPQPPGGQVIGRSVPGFDAGWDERRGEFVLPPLPYPPEALEPHIDAQTMRLHHGAHHASYVAGANRALAELARLREGQGDPGLIKHWERELAFHGSGHINHCIFWMVMGPPQRGAAGRPGGPLAQAIDSAFGSFEKFLEQFRAAAGAVEGSGWAWLAHEPMSRRLLILQAEKHQNLTIWGARPVLGVDVWEHAYYLKYQNKRADYVSAFLSVINWSAVGALYERAAVG